MSLNVGDRVKVVSSGGRCWLEMMNRLVGSTGTIKSDDGSQVYLVSMDDIKLNNTGWGWWLDEVILAPLEGQGKVKKQRYEEVVF